MTSQKFKSVASSFCSSTENRKRKDVFIDSPPCWDENYEHEVFATSKKYYRKYLTNGSEQEQHRNMRYKIYVPLKSSNKVIVEVRFRTEGGRETITSEPLPMYQALGMQEIVDQGLDFWNERFNIKISDPLRKEQCCRTRVMQIEYRVVWLDTPLIDEFNDLKKVAEPGFYHSKMIVYETLERERVVNGLMEISLTTNTYIAAHEYAHLLGIPDEYPDEENGESVRYVRPDNSLDAPIDILKHKELSSPLAGVMSTAYSFATVPRHAWNIAIEVQELLSKKLGRTIKCEIIQLR